MSVYDVYIQPLYYIIYICIPFRAVVNKPSDTHPHLILVCKSAWVGIYRPPHEPHTPLQGKGCCPIVYEYISTPSVQKNIEDDKYKSSV